MFVDAGEVEQQGEAAAGAVHLHWTVGDGPHLLPTPGGGGRVDGVEVAVGVEVVVPHKHLQAALGERLFSQVCRLLRGDVQLVHPLHTARGVQRRHDLCLHTRVRGRQGDDDVIVQMHVVLQPSGEIHRVHGPRPVLTLAGGPPEPEHDSGVLLCGQHGGGVEGEVGEGVVQRRVGAVGQEGVQQVLVRLGVGLHEQLQAPRAVQGAGDEHAAREVVPELDAEVFLDALPGSSHLLPFSFRSRPARFSLCGISPISSRSVSGIPPGEKTHAGSVGLEVSVEVDAKEDPGAEDHSHRHEKAT